MAQVNRTVLKGYFETGDTPTEAQFIDLIDSLFNDVEDNTDDITEGSTNLFYTPARAAEKEEVTERPSTQPVIVTGTPNTLTLDCNSRKAARFEPRLDSGTRTINVDFTLNLSNATNIEDIHFVLSLSGTRIITFNETTISLSEVLGSVFSWDDSSDALTISAGTDEIFEFILYKDSTSGSYLLKAAGAYV
jgi:hypothetical protein